MYYLTTLYKSYTILYLPILQFSGQYQNFLENLSTGKHRNLHLFLLDVSDSFDAKEMFLYIILFKLNLYKQL